MQKRLFTGLVTAIICVCLMSEMATAQSDSPKFELGGQFTLMRQANTGSFSDLDPGFGGRLSFNVIKSVDVEAEVNFFPQERDLFSRGRKTQGLFGIKAGLRKDKFGLFGKLRPGFMHFNRFNNNCSGNDVSTCGRFGKTEFVIDLGGVAEFYPSRRTVLRFDVGDTVIKFTDTNVAVPFPEAPGGILRFTEKGRTTHNLQISVGIGFRF